ncbi:hypothetical protein D4A92_15955 [Rhizobium rosettiformans]|uniref:DUF2493 domain-containing protein n=1 Tax=Rhizobium rosettiformans TaxID=1368430 RepID=A0ABX7F0E1_9HYPH|nr:hypothetical protein D4A92_15955 [Rhizobium rosettiformans]
MIFRWSREGATRSPISHVKALILGAGHPQVFEQQARSFAKALKSGAPFAQTGHFGTKYSP